MINTSFTSSCNEFEKLLLETNATSNINIHNNTEIPVDKIMANAMLEDANIEYVKSTSSSDLAPQSKSTTSSPNTTPLLVSQNAKRENIAENFTGKQLKPQQDDNRGAPEASVVTSGESTGGGGGGGGETEPQHHASTDGSKRKLCEFRSVQIEAPTPSDKRQRVDDVKAASTKHVVQALNMSFAKQDRIAAITQAKDAFFHPVQALHDDEIQDGADEALVKHLAFLSFKTTFRRRSGVFAGDEDVNSLLDEASLACEALELIYRASSNSVASSFRRLGPELLHALVTIIDGELSRRKYGIAREMSETENAAASAKSRADEASHQNVSSAAATGSDGSTVGGDESIATNDNATAAGAAYRDNNAMRSVTPTGTAMQHTTPCCIVTIQKGTEQGDLLLRSATKILGHLARVGEATKPMAYFPGVLGCVLQLISSYWYDSIPWEARLSSLWTLANLACNTDNMQMMMCTPGLVRSLVCIGCRSLHPQDSMELTMEVLRSRSITSRAILNLSWLPENKIPLSENATLVELLAKFAVLRRTPPLISRSRTVRDILLQTRRHSVSAIRNLAAAPRRNKIRLCQYNNGYLLDVLTDVALNDTDEQTKDRAFAAIHNLAVHDTAVMMVERPALVLALKGALLLDEEVHNTRGETIDTPKSHASATLLVLERTITPDMECYQHLRDLLEAVNPTVPSDCEDERDNSNDDKNHSSGLINNNDGKTDSYNIDNDGNINSTSNYTESSNNMNPGAYEDSNIKTNDTSTYVDNSSNSNYNDTAQKDDYGEIANTNFNVTNDYTTNGINNDNNSDSLNHLQHSVDQPQHYYIDHCSYDPPAPPSNIEAV